MGVVWKAKDLRLERIVAIKILPAGRTDPERRRRFLQEAKAASALNHPNIITIYEVDSADGHDFIVMEYVKGKSLSELIRETGGLPVQQALRCGVAIADALAAAHGAGIIHRDLKPGNVMVADNGMIKLLDFGLAKLVEPAGSAELAADAPTEYMPMQTQAGIVVGTLSYMSPEQAVGDRVDARSDIFSFGVVLYEMLSGERLFDSGSKLATFSAILSFEPPPLGEIKADIPEELDRVVSRCLRKDPDVRYQDIADVKIALLELKDDGSGYSTSSTRSRIRSMPSSRTSTAMRKRSAPDRTWKTAAVAALIVVGAALAGVAGWRYLRLGGSSAAAPPAYAVHQLTFNEGLTYDPALSGDGKFIAYASDRGTEGNLDIWAQQVGGQEVIRVTNDPAEDNQPDYSPDGRTIAFHSTRQPAGIYLVSALGGEARLVAQAGLRPRFSPDGANVAFWMGPTPGLPYGKVGFVSVLGGQPKWLVDQFYGASSPIWTPDGKHLMFGGASKPNLEDWDWWVAPIAGGAPARTGVRAALAKAGAGGALALPQPGTWDAKTGSVVFSADEGGIEHVWRIPMSQKDWRPSGAPARITAGTGESEPTIGGGLIAFSGISRKTNVWALPLNANQARATGPLQRVTMTSSSDYNPSVSENGRVLVYESQKSLVDSDLWAKDLPDGKPRQLTVTPWFEYNPSVSADGSTVAFTVFEEPPNVNDKEWIAVAPVATGAHRKLCDKDCFLSWGLNSNGSQVLYSADLRHHKLAVLNVADGSKKIVADHPDYELFQGMFSPDDKWVSFMALAGGTQTIVYIVPAKSDQPLPPEKWIRIGDGKTGDDKPRWSPDGNLLYFLSRRDGFPCLWAQKLDRITKQPAGDAVAVAHFHGVRNSMAEIPSHYGGIAIGVDRAFMPLSDLNGNVWLLEPKPAPGR